MGKLMSVQQVGKMVTLAQKTLAESLGNVQAVRACSDHKDADHRDLERREIRIARVAVMHLQAEIARLNALAVLAAGNENGVVYDEHGAILTTSDEIAEALLMIHSSDDEEADGDV